jgi:hypothetical protein
MSQNQQAQAGLSPEELAEETGAALPVREAMSVLDLGGLGGRVLPPLAPVDEPGPPPIVPTETAPS